jgi:hypothetical protein
VGSSLVLNLRQLLSLALLVFLVVVWTGCHGCGARPMAVSFMLPSFPWPPPTASAREVIPNDFLLGNSSAALLRNINDELVSALGKNGYFERSYFQAPGGFALVTRLEQIEEDGRSKPIPGRWSAGSVRSEGDSWIVSYLRALFTAQPGYYRVIVFIVSDTPFGESGQVKASEAEAWLQGGVNFLPDAIARLPYTRQMACTALIYEFKREGNSQASSLLTPSHLDARTHLVNSGLWANLASGQ